MELLYFWVDDYLNIKEQGFNFSNKYLFDYDEKTNTLTVKKRTPEPIDGFFGEHISNVTAIVGENGAGKSNLIDHLYKFIIEGTSKSFLITKKYIFFGNGRKRFLKINSDFKIKLEELEMELFPRQITIHYTASFDLDFVGKMGTNLGGRDQPNFEPYPDNHKSISSLQLLIDDYQEMKGGFKIHGISEIMSFIQKENERFVNFLSSPIKDKVDKSLFNFSKLIFSIELNDNDETYLSGIDDSLFTGILYENPDRIGNINSRIMKIIDDLFPKSNDDIILLKEYFYKWSFQFWLKLYIQKTIEPDNIEHQEACLKLLFNSNSKEEDSSIINRVKLFHKRLIFYYNQKADTYGHILARIPRLKDILSAFDNLFNIIVQNRKKLTITFRNGFPKINIPCNTSGLTVIYAFVTFYQKIKFDVLNDRYKPSFVDFTWNGLSSGERTLLSFFSRIYSVKQNLEDKGIYQNFDNVLLTIDEGEVSLHPEWQKRYINYLLTFIPLVFKEKKTQILITTHSPFILSDLPFNNTIFLEKDECTENNETFYRTKVVNQDVRMSNTFGANIHTLLADGFFLKGLVGEFAKSKIEEVLKWLNNKDDKNELKHYRQIINLIGEPIVQDRLLEMYYDKMEIEIKEQEIDELEARLATLKKEIKDKQ